MTLNIQETVFATKVNSGKERLTFAAESFRYMRIEEHVFHCMGSLCSDYDGGLWEYYRLSNGGWYIAPSQDEEDQLLHMEVAGNYFSGEVSPDAAGIICCMFVLCALNAQAYDYAVKETDPDKKKTYMELNEYLHDTYHQLREFALDHKECAMIFRAID